MTFRSTAAAALLCAAPALAAAQGFSGAEISAEILGFTEDLDFGETKYSGGAEFAVTGGVSVEADLAFRNFRGFGGDARNATFHGIYDGLGPKLGLFVARDALEDGDVDLYGVEAATDLMGAGVEASFAQFGGDGGDGQVMTLDGRYAILGFAATASAGLIRGEYDDGGEFDASRIAIGGEYALGLGPTLFGEVGRVSSEDEDDTYVSLGARIAIGPNNGTTFGPRGLFEVIPGY